MKRFSIAMTIGLINIVGIIGCSSLTSSGPSRATLNEEDEKIFIVDRTGKKWDVTHAKENYDMEPSEFQFGLGPNAITPIQNAKMLSLGEEGYPHDSERFLILGTTLNGDTRAYPISELTRHEIADEKIGLVYVAVAYWPLVDLAAVYSRRIDGKILTLSASGWTYKDTFVLYDYETESLWYHLEGTDGLTCISGEFADLKLEEFQSTKTRWNTWKSMHPDTKFLDTTSF